MPAPNALHLLFLLSLAAIGLNAGVAIASNGVIEINQACAVQTGCFAGDTAGFPVTVYGLEGRSIRLTSELIVPAGADGIDVGSRSVSLDLGGFEIVSAACAAAVTDCRPNSATGGAAVTGFSGGLSVKNGSVTGMANGITIGSESIVENIRARWNRFTGIRVSNGSVVTKNTAFQNGGSGIRANYTTVISGNTSTSNGLDGVRVSAQCIIEGNVSRINTVAGIRCTSQADGCTVRNNESNANLNHGIQVETESLVISNSVHGNAGSGVEVVGSNNRIEANTSTDNQRAFQVLQGGNLIVKNSASGSSSGNYVIAPGNSHGPLVSVEGVGNIDAVAGADSPWANFGF